jgi:hypothetical protein
MPNYRVHTTEIGGNPDYYQEITLTSLFVQYAFSGLLSTITLVNDSPTDQAELSFDGATIQGSVRPGESLVLHVDQKSSVWVRGSAGGDTVRLFGWASSVTASSIKTSAQPLGVVNKSYEGTLVVGISPLILDFNGDTGRNAVDGWITCDGTSVEMTVAFSRDGTTFGDDWTIRSGENTGLRNFDIDQLRLTHTGDDVPYRVVLI